VSHDTGDPRQSRIAVLGKLWDSVGFWRATSGVLATLSLALLVSGMIARRPPDFSPVIGVVRDGEHRAVWAIRLDRTSHQIAADSLRLPTGSINFG
jgi:hypothetical protein